MRLSNMQRISLIDKTCRKVLFAICHPCNFLYNYEDRIKALPIESRKINFYTASLEDIVIAKLYSSRPSDIIDIGKNQFALQ